MSAGTTAVEGSEAVVSYNGQRFDYRLNTDDVERTIASDCIVGFLPRHDASHEHVLLYVKIDEADATSVSNDNGDDEKQQPTAETRTLLRSLRISHPPEDFVKAYTPSDLSWILPLSSSPTEEETKTRASTSFNEYHRTTVIISTNSGSRSANTVFTNLIEPFLAAVGSRNHHVVRTTSAESITTHTTQTVLPNASAGLPQTIILLSGDGGPVDTINAILSATPSTTSLQQQLASTPTATNIYTPPTLAILPLGTGNALAHSTHIASDRTLGLSSLLRGRPTPLPLLRATLPQGSYALDAHGRPATTPSPAETHVHGAVVFSWALHASLVADSDTDAYRAHGAARFRMAAMENLFPGGEGSEEAPHVYRGSLSVARTAAGAGRAIGDDDDEAKLSTLTLGEEHAYVLVTLVSNLEEKFCVSPHSRPMDGRLRVVRVPPMEDGGKGIMRIMGLAYEGGKHIGERKVDYEEVRAVKLRIEETEERWRRVCLDGKIFVVGEGGEVNVRREEGHVADLVVLGES